MIIGPLPAPSRSVVSVTTGDVVDPSMFFETPSQN